METKLIKLFSAVLRLFGLQHAKTLQSSSDYWLKRYETGGNSGPGSYQHLAEFKAEIINSLVQQYHIQSVIEFGCGDGNQLILATYPNYLGIDISPVAIKMCREKFQSEQSKRFVLQSEYQGETADMALSLDVIYHLVEDEIFNNYMNALVSSAHKLIVIYSSDTDDNTGNNASHVWHRQFSRWMELHAPQWHLLHKIPNRYPYNGDYTTTAFADFYIYTASIENEAAAKSSVGNN